MAVDRLAEDEFPAEVLDTTHLPYDPPEPDPYDDDRAQDRYEAQFGW